MASLYHAMLTCSAQLIYTVRLHQIAATSNIIGVHFNTRCDPASYILCSYTMKVWYRNIT